MNPATNVKWTIPLDALAIEPSSNRGRTSNTGIGVTNHENQDLQPDQPK